MTVTAPESQASSATNDTGVVRSRRRYGSPANQEADGSSAALSGHVACEETGQQNQVRTPASTADDRIVSKKVYAVSVRWESEQRERASRAQQIGSDGGPISGNEPPLTYTVEDFHNYCCCCARRVGSMFFLIEKPDGTPVIVAGPCWPFCTFVTVPLIVGLGTLVGVFIVSNPSAGLPWWFGFIYYPLLLFVLVVLSCVSCRDPGLMERVTDEEAADADWFWNEQVGSYRPAKAMYCRECKALVNDYDHVCPWTGTVIGKNNIRCFKLFVFSVNVLCYLCVGLVIWQVLDKLTR
mmetsp:Transcript_19908/g.46763  ORF Transcript_19908/g.46763 Transcript_19908/m.46763 type:complete len:295 (-) Transcript_19908:450-1334(-)